MAGLLRPLWAAPDHAALLSAAVDVAAADGLDYLGRLLAAPAAPGRPSLLAALRRGAVDADYPASGGYILHLYHFHQPWTHRGYADSPVSGARVTAALFNKALHLWRAGRRAKAAYQLGRASHPLADCWVPYRAAGVLLCGHGPYEAWLTEGDRWREWLPGGGGRYSWQLAFRPDDGGPPHVLDWRTPYHWVDLAAHESYPWFTRCLDGCAGVSGVRLASFFPEAAAALVPGAVRYLAGFLHYFFTLAGAAPAGSEAGPG